MPRLPDTRFSLIARLTDSADGAAWSEFVSLYEQAIFRYSRSRGLQDADAWEVVQRVLLAVHQKMRSWQPTGQPGAFRCWLLRTAHRICLSSLRDATRRDRAVGGPDDEEFLHAAPENASRPDPQKDWQQWAFCWAAGFVEQEVEPQTWQAFWKTAVDGLSAKDAAQALGMKVGSVYTARCRVVARIREMVESLSRSEL